MAGVTTAEDEKKAELELLTLRVPIAPRPASRPRFSSKGCVYNAPDYRKWLTEFKLLARPLWGKNPLQHCEHMEVVFNGTSRRGDIDNYLKASLDGLVYAGVIKNDNLNVLDSVEVKYSNNTDLSPSILFNIYI